MTFLFVVRAGRTVRAVGGRAVRAVTAAVRLAAVRRAVEAEGAGRVQVVVGAVVQIAAVMQSVGDVILQQQILVERRVRVVQVLRQMMVLAGDGRQLLAAAVQQIEAVRLVIVDHALHHVVAQRVELQARAELLAVAELLAAVVVHHFVAGRRHTFELLLFLRKEKLLVNFDTPSDSHSVIRTSV